MTVLNESYAPTLIPYTEGVDVYSFEYEIIGPDAFELWYVDTNDDRTLASPDRYYVTFTGSAPLWNGGTVTLTKPPLDGTTTLSLERNTPLTQLLDFGEWSAFPLRMVEFTLDKHTMICQELASRKCTVTVSGGMTQLISFDPYTPFYADEVTYALDKIIDILNEISSTSTDCSTTPEDT